MRITKDHPIHYVKSSDQGIVTALVSVFGNVDHDGDRVMPGAFRKSLGRWRTSGLQIPVLFSHDWLNPMAHIGVVLRANETKEGLEVRYKLDLDNEWGAQVFKLIKERRLTEHSFAYEIVREKMGADSANELLELDIIEIGPTLKGSNSATRVLSAKTNLLPYTTGSSSTSTTTWSNLPAKKSDPTLAEYKRRIDALAPVSKPRPVKTAQGDAFITQVRQEMVEKKLAESHAQRDAERDQAALNEREIPKTLITVEAGPRSTDKPVESTEQTLAVKDDETFYGIPMVTIERETA